MVTLNRIRCLSIATIAIVGAALFFCSPAEGAFDGQEGSGHPVNAPAPTSAPSPSRTGDTGTATVGKCDVRAGAWGYGQVCTNPQKTSTGRVLTISEILSGDPLPVCWRAPLTADELTTDHLNNTTTYTWFSERCLLGVGPAPTYAVAKDGVRISYALLALSVGSTATRLTVNQQRLIAMYSAGSGDYPPVIAIPTGSGVARVNQHVAFRGAPAVAPRLQVGGTTIEPHVVALTIHPLGKGTEPSTSCTGAGTSPEPSATPTTPKDPAICWFQFRNSSADQPGQAYPMVVTATWEVRATDQNPDNTPWQTWPLIATGIKVTTTTNQRVTEIQTIVVN